MKKSEMLILCKLHLETSTWLVIKYWIRLHQPLVAVGDKQERPDSKQGHLGLHHKRPHKGQLVKPKTKHLPLNKGDVSQDEDMVKHH